MRRFLFISAVILGVIGFSPSPSASASDHSCVGSIDKVSLTATSNGHCILVSYKYKDGVEPGDANLQASLPQKYMGEDSGDKTTLVAPTVACAGQIDLIDDTATVERTSLTSTTYYSDQGVLVDHYNYGPSPCLPKRPPTECESPWAPSSCLPPSTTAPTTTAPTEVEGVTVERPAVAVATTPRFTG